MYTTSSSFAHPTKAQAAFPPFSIVNNASSDHDASDRYALSSFIAIGERRSRRAGVESDEAPRPDAKARIRRRSLVYKEMI